MQNPGALPLIGHRQRLEGQSNWVPTGITLDGERVHTHQVNPFSSKKSTGLRQHRIPASIRPVRVVRVLSLLQPARQTFLRRSAPWMLTSR